MLRKKVSLYSFTFKFCPARDLFLLYSLMFGSQDLESQMQQESDTAGDTIQSLEENITEEKQRRDDAEQELLKQKKVRCIFCCIVAN